MADKLLGDGKRYIELAELNGIAAPYTIHVGQVLSIDGTRLYTVKAGDSPWRIAQELLGDGRRYGEIVQLNGLKEPYTIYTGQILKIPRK
ncbi:MAG TPA: peptidoglycan-binding protein [Clostridiales bacterium]|nr:peptidoglycan-binding protein [Clostridiales bacterium]